MVSTRMNRLTNAPRSESTTRQSRRSAPSSRLRTVSTKSGQSIIESSITVALISILFFGLVQMALLFTAKEVVTYAANKGARARTVGFNNFMILTTQVPQFLFTMSKSANINWLRPAPWWSQGR